MGTHVSAIQAAVSADVYPVVMDNYARAMASAIYPQFCKVLPHDPRMEYGEKISVLGGLGLYTEVEDGVPTPHDTAFQAYQARLKVREFALGTSFDYRLIEAAGAKGALESSVAGGSFIEQVCKWAENAARTKDTWVAGVLQYGTLTAGSTKYFNNSFEGEVDTPGLSGLIYDTQPFFDTAHTVYGSSSTFSNHEAAGSLSAANLETYVNTMRSTNAVDERGLTIVNEPNVLVVPPGLEMLANRVLQSDNIAGSANNDINAIKGRLKVIANPFLSLSASSAAGWIGIAGAGIRVRESAGPVIQVWDDPANRRVMVAATFKFGVAVEDWRPWFNFGKAAS